MTDLRYWLLLQSIEGVGPVTFKNLLDKFHTPKLIFESSKNELKIIPRLNLKIIDQILNANDRLERIDTILEQLRNRNIKVITINDTDYPKPINKISNPPALLYLMNPIPSGKTIGIIGTRNASQHGKEEATKFAQALSQNDYIIVSGYAKGIDTAAHYGAISASGKTIAILPTGILKFRLHEKLSEYSNIFYNYATILSEFFPLSEWSVGNALLRNRITAALSDYILVIESGDSGGTVNTVEYAKQLCKKVFLYKGITSVTDEKIIAFGAIPVNNIRELNTDLDT